MSHPFERLRPVAKCDWRDEIGHHSYVDMVPDTNGEFVRYAAPRVTDEMVQRALEAYFPDGTYGIHRRMADDVQSIVFDHMRAAISAAIGA